MDVGRRSGVVVVVVVAVESGRRATAQPVKGRETGRATGGETEEGVRGVTNQHHARGDREEPDRDTRRDEVQCNAVESII